MAAGSRLGAGATSPFALISADRTAGHSSAHGSCVDRPASSPSSPHTSPIYRGEARLDADGVSGSMADSGLGTSRAGGHSNPGGEVLKEDTATCGYCYRGGLSALLPSPAIVTGDGWLD